MSGDTRRSAAAAATVTPTVDVRGTRFVASVSTAVLAAAVVVAGFTTTAAAVLLGWQTAVFVAGAVGGPRRNPYGVAFRVLVAPRLGPATRTEPAAPLRFAALVGAVFTATAAVAFASAGADAVFAVGLGAATLAMVAAFLNAAFGLCLACLVYPVVARRRPTSTA